MSTGKSPAGPTEPGSTTAWSSTATGASSGSSSSSNGGGNESADPDPTDGSSGGESSECGEPFEGYGSMAVGGAGGDEYHVTSLDGGGAGSLRDGVENRDGARTIVFDVAGTINLTDSLVIRAPFLTIDGCSASAPGITITHTAANDAILEINGTHDVLVQGLRFQGLWTPGAGTGKGADKISIDGDAGPDFEVSNVVFDHVTIAGGGDAALDIWGEVHDVTISWSFLHDSARGGILSHYPSPYQTRERLTYHHNVYSRNTERNPQIRADVRDFDFVNNILHDWGVHDPSSGYGIRIRNDGSEPPVHANFIGNAFVSSVNPDRAFIDAGSGSQLWLEDNAFPDAFNDDPGTLAAAIPTPEWAQVDRVTSGELGDVVLPSVGAPHRNAEEQALIDEIGAAL